MGIFRQFPYSNFHEMNMDEIIKIMREMQDEWAATKTEWNNMQDFINNYFDNLDVSAEVLQALRSLAADGTLNQIIDPVIASSVTTWLNANITPTTPVVDSTLSISAAAADAKATGEHFIIDNNLFQDIYKGVEVYKNLVRYIAAGRYCALDVNNHVSLADDANRSYVKIPVIAGEYYSINIPVSPNFSFWVYNTGNTETGLGRITSGGGIIQAPDRANYLYLCNTGWNANTNLVVMQLNKNISGYSKYDYRYNALNHIHVDSITGDFITKLSGYHDNLNNAIGNIAITTNGWTFSSSTTRVRNNEDQLYNLKMGDIITLSDYDNVRMYIGYRANNTYFTAGWLQHEFIVPFDCEAVIILSYVSERAITTAYELSKYLKIWTREGYKKYMNSLDINSNSAVKSISHQGLNSIAPAESAPAYILSKQYGYKYVECDILKTADNKYVLGHDNNLATSGIYYHYVNDTYTLVTEDINISDLTYEELTTNYRMRKSLNDQWLNVTTLRLENFMRLCKKLSLHAYIELKTGGSADTANVYNIVKRYGMLQNVTFTSTVIQYLNQVRNLDSNTRVGLVTSTITDEIISNVSTLNTDNNAFINALHANLTETIINNCIAANVPLECWIIDNINVAKNLDPYITGVTSNVLNIGYLNYMNNINL